MPAIATYFENSFYNCKDYTHSFIHSPNTYVQMLAVIFLIWIEPFANRNIQKLDICFRKFETFRNLQNYENSIRALNSKSQSSLFFLCNIILAILFTFTWTGYSYITKETNWVVNSGFLTLSGFCIIPISILWQFMWVRWILKLLLWIRYLWSASYSDLQIVITHPDRMGGLSFLGRFYSILVGLHSGNHFCRFF